MAKVKIIGVQHRKGTSKKTGNPYDMDVLHVAYQNPSRQKEFTGCEVAQIWVDRESGILLRTPTPGDIYDIGFNQAGFLEYADPCK